MRWLHFGVPTKIMSAKLFSIVALSASALLNDSASRFPVATHPSTLSHFHSKKLRRQLTPQGVAHLRSELAALESMEIGENARAAHAREAQELYAALDDSLVWFWSCPYPKTRAASHLQKFSSGWSRWWPTTSESVNLPKWITL